MDALRRPLAALAGTPGSTYLRLRRLQVKLYKYRALKDGDAEALRRLHSALREQSFWCAQPDTLNDDQEFAWRCDYRPTAQTVALLAGLLMRERGWEFAAAWEQIEPFLATGSLERAAEPDIRRLIRRCRSEVGLLCLGTSPSNATLWTRYGANGEGVCIEIDVPEPLINTHFFPVQYAQEKVVHIDELLLSYFADPTNMYSYALLTKLNQWAPEEEIRFISSAQNVAVRRELSKITEDHVRSIAKSLPYEVLLCPQPSA
jgi:hypothetical protein